MPGAGTTGGVSDSRPPRSTIQTLYAMAAAGEPFACLTCYDASTARWLERAGVPVLLVGDTAAEMVLGFTRTIDMPLEVLLALTAGVKRGAPNTLVMGDMPFMSYQAEAGDAIRNAGRFLTEGLADIVKIEADETFASLIERMVRAGIPICGHVGSKPQQVALSGGYASAGRTAEQARQVVADAVALEQAGCQLLLVEAVPPEVAEAIMAATHVPVIGIGAGPACHGQILVLQDLLGMSQWAPRFAEPVAQIGRTIEDAGREWIRRVAARQIGGRPYSMRAGEAERFASDAVRAGSGGGVAPARRPGRVGGAVGQATGGESGGVGGAVPVVPRPSTDSTTAESARQAEGR